MIDTSYFINKFHEWRREIWEHKYLILISLIIFALAMSTDFMAGDYVSYKAHVVNVHDIILDHFGPYNLNFFYVWGFVIFFWSLCLYPFFFKTKKIHIALFQLSILTILRSLFIVLTHLQTPSDAIRVVAPQLFNVLKFSNDQFFSGHVAIPFLGFLLFKESKIKYFFLIGSIIMGITVLGMHQHYSIDVFGAFFITYGSYKIGEWLIKKLKLVKV